MFEKENFLFLFFFCSLWCIDETETAKYGLFFAEKFSKYCFPITKIVKHFCLARKRIRLKNQIKKKNRSRKTDACLINTLFTGHSFKFHDSFFLETDNKQFNWCFTQTKFQFWLQINKYSQLQAGVLCFCSFSHGG